MRVLITGAAGAIGSTLAKGLQARHLLRGLDRVPMPLLEDAVVGDVVDLATVLTVAKGMEAIVHLANVGPDWEECLQSMIGTYNVLEAARQCGVRRIAYASRAGLLPRSFYPRTLQRTVEMLPKPESYYSVTKVFGESLGYMYSVQHGLEVVAVRIGNFNRERDQPRDPHHLSHGDCVRLFEQALIHPGVKYEVVFGVSDSDWPLYDLEQGRRAIGYYPQDYSRPLKDQWQ
ncbi:MAG: NAD(P)-dependent oxidoreductase [Candidatus Handelsmanbacteria bacterium]|nr:NAD(P)-dependent oxidoreductase [Candidatus Handelsmanbacteria bacterium]